MMMVNGTIRQKDAVGKTLKNDGNLQVVSEGSSFLEVMKLGPRRLRHESLPGYFEVEDQPKDCRSLRYVSIVPSNQETPEKSSLGRPWDAWTCKTSQ
jgi:hypothetical protein